MPRVDTLLCDLGNVLAPFDIGRCARALGERAGRDPVEVSAQLRGPEFFALESGELTPPQFFAAVDARLGLGLTEEVWTEAWSDIFTIDEAMVALVERLAARYPTYLWSNGNAVHMAHLRQRLPVLATFRDHHLSYELGAIKPGVQFYERALDRSGLDAARCVFVDDVEANLDGARALGIHTVLHRSASSTERALAALGMQP